VAFSSSEVSDGRVAIGSHRHRTGETGSALVHRSERPPMEIGGAREQSQRDGTKRNSKLP
jgi:hypothetical protein